AGNFREDRSRAFTRRGAVCGAAGVRQCYFNHRGESCNMGIRIVGDIMARPALWRANVTEEFRVHPRFGAHAGAWDWGEYCALHTLQCSRLTAAASQRRAQYREGLPERVGEVFA